MIRHLLTPDIHILQPLDLTEIMASKRNLSDSDQSDTRRGKKSKLDNDTDGDYEDEDLMMDDADPVDSSSQVEESTQRAELLNPEVPDSDIDSILRTFDLEDMKNNGYIDHLDYPRPPVSPDFVVGGVPGHTPTAPHPIFDRDNWQVPNDDAEWASLQPSLQLASRIILEPYMNHFFETLLFGPSEEILDSQRILEEKFGEKLHKFGHAKSTASWMDVLITFDRMANKIHWRWGKWEGDEENAGKCAETQRHLGLPGLSGPYVPSPSKTNKHN